ncbi:MAG: hypothetical protein ACI8ZB_004711 [Desulforhopalus sp.]|jgi:hypothetical protein
MKIVILSLLLTFAAYTGIVSAAGQNIPGLKIELVDSTWDGNNIPVNQQCQKFGGVNPGTPVLHIADLPEGTNAIILEYSDRDSEKMNNGGHGIMGYKVDENVTEITIPSVPGHTFEVAEPFYSISPHRSPQWDIAGAYMPPCSGGKGHEYYVTVKAVSEINSATTVLGQTVLELGKY